MQERIVIVSQLGLRACSSCLFHLYGRSLTELLLVNVIVGAAVAVISDQQKNC